MLKHELPYRKALASRTKKLAKLLSMMMRWPEIITYEEMNGEPPSTILYATLQVIEEEKQKRLKPTK